VAPPVEVSPPPPPTPLVLELELVELELLVGLELELSSPHPKAIKPPAKNIAKLVFLIVILPQSKLLRACYPQA